MLDCSLHAIDDRDSVAVAALLEDGNIDGALSIDAHDVILERARIHGLADVRHQHGGISHGFERH
jgi:hypothetical protein